GVEEKVGIDLSAKSAQFGFGDLLLEEGFAALTFNGFVFAAEGVEAIAALCGDGAQVLEIVADKAGTPGSGRDEQDMADAAGGGYGKHDFDVGYGKEGLERIGVLEFDE